MLKIRNYLSSREGAMAGVYIVLALAAFKIALHYMSPYFTVAAQGTTAPTPAQMRVQEPQKPPFYIEVPVGIEFNHETLPDGRIVPFNDHSERCARCQLPPPDVVVKKPMTWTGAGVPLTFAQCYECGDYAERYSTPYESFQPPARPRRGEQWDGNYYSSVPEGYDGYPRHWRDRSQYYEYYDNDRSPYSRPHHGAPLNEYGSPLFPRPPRNLPQYEYNYGKNQIRYPYEL